MRIHLLKKRKNDLTGQKLKNTICKNYILVLNMVYMGLKVAIKVFDACKVCGSRSDKKLNCKLTCFEETLTFKAKDTGCTESLVAK